MKETRIIATIGNSYEHSRDRNIIQNLYKNNINYLRFNFSKCETDEDITRMLKCIEMIKREFHDEMDIMIDLPMPGKKPRIVLQDGLIKINVKRGDQVYISSDPEYKNDNKIFYTDIDNIGKYVSLNQTIIYSDGDCVMNVVGINNDKNIIEVIINNNCDIYAKKSISFGHIIKNGFIHYKHLKTLIGLGIKSIALSFVSSYLDLLKIKESYDFTNIEIISKIETEQAIRNLDGILDESDAMFARGDISINADICELFNYQNIVSERTAIHDKKYYIATGILESLSTRMIPTQAEIIDLTTILSLQPYAVVLNYGVVKNNIDTAVEYIKKINFITQANK